MKPQSIVELLEASSGKTALGRAARSVTGNTCTQENKRVVQYKKEILLRKKEILLVPYLGTVSEK